MNWGKEGEVKLCVGGEGYSRPTVAFTLGAVTGALKCSRKTLPCMLKQAAIALRYGYTNKFVLVCIHTCIWYVCLHVYACDSVLCSAFVIQDRSCGDFCLLFLSSNSFLLLYFSPSLLFSFFSLFPEKENVCSFSFLGSLLCLLPFCFLPFLSCGWCSRLALVHLIRFPPSFLFPPFRFYFVFFFPFFWFPLRFLLIFFLLLAIELIMSC